MSAAQVSAFLVIVVAIFVAIDVKLSMDKTEGNTYSEVIRNTGNRWPAFRLMFLVTVGTLLGHWFW